MTEIAVEVAIPSVEDYKGKLKTPDSTPFDNLVTHRQMLVDTIGACKESIGQLDKQIGVTMDSIALRAVVSKEGYIVTRTAGRTGARKISAAKLLELHVAPAVIQAATVTGKHGQPGIRVRRPGDKEEDEEV